MGERRRVDVCGYRMGVSTLPAGHEQMDRRLLASNLQYE